MSEIGALTVLELGERREALEREYAATRERLDRELRDAHERRAREQAEAQATLSANQEALRQLQATLVATEEIALLQDTGVYHYRHPLSDAIAYQIELAKIESQIKDMVRKDGGAVEASQSWTVNGSAAQGRAMVHDFSKLLLRAFNAEADNLVRGLKPYKLDAAIDRLRKVAATIERLGKTMSIRLSKTYLQLRIRELELTADFVHKQAEEKEAEREEKIRQGCCRHRSRNAHSLSGPTSESSQSAT